LVRYELFKDINRIRKERLTYVQTKILTPMSDISVNCD